MVNYLNARGHFSIAVENGTKRQLEAFEFFEGILLNKTHVLGAGVFIPKLSYTAEELMPQVARFWGGQPSVTRFKKLPQPNARKPGEPYDHYTRPLARQILFANFEDQILQGDLPKLKKWKDIAAQRAQYILADPRNINANAFVGEEGFPAAAEYLLQNTVMKNKALYRAFLDWDKKNNWLKRHDARLDEMEKTLSNGQKRKLKELRSLRPAAALPANINTRKKKL